jgi:pimeloyl-ACP methyl ester carboxylesterase
MATETVQFELSTGRIEARCTGEGAVTLIFLHGLLVNGHVWDPLIPLLENRVRLVLLDLPLGGHPQALSGDADCSLVAHADRVIEIARMQQGPLVLVGSDTGGALAQLAVTRAPNLFAKLILLPADAFDNCPPKLLVPVRWLAWVPGALALIAWALRAEFAMRITLKLVARARPDRAALDRLVGDFRTSVAVQRDFGKLLRNLDPAVTLQVAQELHCFVRPVLIVWSNEDLLFPLSHAHRLASCFPDSTLHVVSGSRAFVSLDQPALLAHHIRDFLGAG